MGTSSRLAADQRRALARLRRVRGAAARLYLAGGTAVAWHLGHRRSNDVDLFSLSPSLDLAALRRAITAKLATVEVLTTTDVTLRIRAEGIPVDFVRYPYPLLDKPRVGPEGFLVAGLRDLAAMKLATIASRGLRRDFWDLYAILRSGESLTSAVVAYGRRFGAAEPEVYHLARALTYFEDAEREELLPAGMTPALWRKIKAFFRREAPRLLGSQ